MKNNGIENQAIVCDLTSIPAESREKHVATSPRIFQAVQEICELPDGYAFRLPNEAGMFITLAHFVENERLCCPFYKFGLEVESNGGPLWLRMTGSGGAKQLLELILSEQDDKATAKQLINTNGDELLDQAVEQAVVELRGVLQKPVY